MLCVCCEWMTNHISFKNILSWIANTVSAVFLDFVIFFCTVVPKLRTSHWKGFDDLSPQVFLKLCKKNFFSAAEPLYHFLLHFRNPPTISNLWIWLGNILTPNMSPCLQTVLQIRSAFSVRWVQTVLMGEGCQSWEKILFAVWWCVQYGCHSGSESACAC